MTLYQDESNSPSAACRCTDTLSQPGKKLPLAIASIPIQPWEVPSAPASGLKQGSIFPSLVLPFFKEGGNVHV